MLDQHAACSLGASKRQLPILVILPNSLPEIITDAAMDVLSSFMDHGGHRNTMMKHVRLGSTGMDVSAIALGSWMFGTKYHPEADDVVNQAGAAAILDQAAELGINFIDTANIYGSGLSETYIGNWLRNKEREDYIVASKVFHTLRGAQKIGLSRKIVMAEIEGSLQRLGTDYLDIYYIHGWLDGAPLAETWRQ